DHGAQCCRVFIRRGAVRRVGFPLMPQKMSHPVLRASESALHVIMQVTGRPSLNGGTAYASGDDDHWHVELGGEERPHASVLVRRAEQGILRWVALPVVEVHGLRGAISALKAVGGVGLPE